MESNAEDKMMRKKLKGIEFPFEPAAWEKMEAMLGKEEKKRRGFFWWWFSGAALFALMASGVGYLLLNSGTSSKQLLVNENNKHEQTSTLAENSNNTNAPVASISPVSEGKETKTQNNFTSEKTEKTPANNQLVKPQTKSSSQTKQSPKKIESGNQKAISPQKNENTGNQPIGNAYAELSPVLEEDKTSEIGGATNSGKESGGINQIAEENSEPAQGNQKQVLGENTNETNKQATLAEIETLSSLPNNITIPEGVMIEEIQLAATDSSVEEKQQEIKPVPDQQKIKKKIAFNYALGAMGGVTASVVKSNPDKNIRDGIYKKPSFSVGFVQEFILAKRVGIVSGVMYSQTSYDVDSPKTWTLPTRPTYYSSSVSEIQIPIGLKVYPVVKDNFRFFISAGVINHIKIKENFSYTGPKTDTIEEPNKTVVTNTMFPEQTDFNGTGFGQNTSYDVLNNLTSAPSTTSQIVNTDDFAINGVSRYYTSFYASMGVDFVVKKHLVLSAEPTFFMLLQKVGVQEKRKYNFGLNVGMKYMFGL